MRAVAHRTEDSSGSEMDVEVQLQDSPLIKKGTQRDVNCIVKNEETMTFGKNSSLRASYIPDFSKFHFDCDSQEVNRKLTNVTSNDDPKKLHDSMIQELKFPCQPRSEKKMYLLNPKKGHSEVHIQSHNFEKNNAQVSIVAKQT